MKIMKKMKKIYRCFLCGKCKKKEGNNNSITTPLIILGNGPSLKKDLPEIIKNCLGQSFMVVNSFAVSEEFQNIQPKFYVIADNGYWIENPSKFSINDRITLLEVLKIKLTWKITFLLPDVAEHSSFCDELLQNPLVTIVYLKSQFHSPYVFCDKNKLLALNIISVPYPNVLIEALYGSLYLGYTNIFFFGADHDWFKDISVKSDNRVYITENHFYGDKDHKFHLFEKPEGTSFKMSELFKLWAQAFSVYEELQSFASFKKAKVYNSSSNSFIDSFDRKLPW